MATRANPAPPQADLPSDALSCTRTQDIIAAASDLLGEHGPDGLTIRAVLKRTGLARRAFYDRFAGKDDLVLAVFDRSMAEAAAFFAQEVATAGEPIEAMRLIVVGMVLGALDRPDSLGAGLVAAIIHEHMRLAQTRPEELQKALAPLLTVIAERISAGIRSGQLRNCDPGLQATLIYNLVATTLHTELLREDNGVTAAERRQWLADEIWEFCRRAIVA